MKTHAPESATDQPAAISTTTVPASQQSSGLTLLFGILPSVVLVGVFVLVRWKHGRD